MKLTKLHIFSNVLTEQRWSVKMVKKFDDVKTFKFVIMLEDILIFNQFKTFKNIIRSGSVHKNVLKK